MGPSLLQRAWSSSSSCWAKVVLHPKDGKPHVRLSRAPRYMSTEKLIRSRYHRATYTRCHSCRPFPFLATSLGESASPVDSGIAQDLANASPSNEALCMGSGKWQVSRDVVHWFLGMVQLFELDILGSGTFLVFCSSHLRPWRTLTNIKRHVAFLPKLLTVKPGPHNDQTVTHVRHWGDMQCYCRRLCRENGSCLSHWLVDYPPPYTM